MIPHKLVVDGRRVRFALSDNESAHGPEGPGSEPVWAVNLHGYFAGGGMYWRESSNLAEALGWRVLNPSLPGFAGSDPLPWERVTIGEISDVVGHLLDEVGAERAVLLGHSMGGAVAVQFAHDHPRRTLGLIYRDGISTPAWKERTGILPALLSPILPDVAPMVDMVAAVVFDLPDLAIGRLYSTVRAVLPDMRQNIRTVSQTLPVGSMLMGVDQRSEVRHLAAQQIPILNEWGCFDRITPGHTALEFAAIARSPVIWVPGGHSWMLARPQGQADMLTHLVRGRDYVDQIEDRWRQLTPRETTLRAVN
jgi:pimeloyl-ACP methyl ester carboxylesterase